MILIEAGLVVYQFARDLSRAVVEVLGLVQHLLRLAALGGVSGRFALAQVLARACERERRRVEHCFFLLLLAELRIVAQVGCDSQVVRASVEQHASRLLLRAKIDGTDVAGAIIILQLNAEASLRETGLIIRCIGILLLSLLLQIGHLLLMLKLDVGAEFLRRANDVVD